MTPPAAPSGRPRVPRLAPGVRAALARCREVEFFVFVVSVAWIAALETMFSSRAGDGVHFQSWTSDVMQQTLPIAILRDFPLRSLYYLHIQPPLLDVLRASIAQLVRLGPDTSLIVAVDRWLYIVQAVLFGFMAMRMYQWARRLTDRWFALALWIAWIIHPAPLFYATLLDSTFLSSFFIFLFFYELWRLPLHDGSIYRVAMFGLGVFFTRTVFQWYYIPVAVVALVLSRLPWRQVAVFAAVSVLAVAPWLAKQKLLFGTLSTTTFSGYHQAGIIWYHPTADELEAARRQLDYRYPEAAKRYEGGKEFNTESVAVDNLVYAKLSARQWATQRSRCIEGIERSIRQNYQSFWWPSSRYKPNVMVDALPWRDGYDYLFSHARYWGFLFVGTLAWLWSWRDKWRRLGRRATAVLGQLGRELGPVVVASFIFATFMLANRYDWVEVDRLKFLLEPVFFLFVPTCVYNVVKNACSPFIKRG